MPSNKKKVLFTSHTANFQKFNRPFMRMLREQGYEVHYASMGEEQIEDCDKQFVVPFTRSPFTLSNVRAYRQLKEIIDREQYDLIHTHTPVGSVVTRLAARQARQRGTRVIYTAHGFHFFTGAPLLNWLVYYPIERLMAHYTDVLITINAEDYARANRHFATSVVYVPGVGVDLTVYKSLTKREKQHLRQEYGFHKNDFILIYAAELNKNKNQGFLIRMMTHLLKTVPTAKLVLCGVGSKEQQYKALAQQLGIADHVKFMGYRRDMPQLLGISDVSVSASGREGLPVNVLEAASVGLPVVALPCRGIQDIAQQTPLVQMMPDRDTKRMADVLASIATSEADTSVQKVDLSRYETHSIKKMMERIYE